MANAADVIVETLMDWQVDTSQQAIRFIQVRHEKSAGLMATAYAKWRGKVGVCLATSGQGFTNLLTVSTVPSWTKCQYVPSPACNLTTFTQQDVNLTRAFEE